MLRAVLFRKDIKMGKKINERKNKKTGASALNTQSMIQEENKDEQPCALEIRSIFKRMTLKHKWRK